MDSKDWTALMDCITGDGVDDRPVATTLISERNVIQMT
jgi:hypothetical protein